ncbi:MAG: sigma-70 family RNA polymerase sigma factor [Candidatus Sumerlaeia bacterium]|nr:sigma-70 family RNA polymerase sigma factor [Candidatus Sumerlaeia bacterium]
MKPVATAACDPGDEQQAIQRAREGDLAAFDCLIRRYEDQVFSVAYRMVGDEDDAADISQEVFLAFFRHLKDYRGDAKISTWLHRITINTVKNFWSRRKRQGYDLTQSLDDCETGADEGLSPIEVIPDSAPDPRRVAAGVELAEMVERQLQRIEPEFREVIVLRFIEELSYEEIAEITGEPLGTVKSRLFRARRLLKDLLRDYLHEIPEPSNV